MRFVEVTNPLVKRFLTLKASRLLRDAYNKILRTICVVFSGAEPHYGESKAVQKSRLPFTCEKEERELKHLKGPHSQKYMRRAYLYSIAFIAMVWLFFYKANLLKKQWILLQRWEVQIVRVWFILREGFMRRFQSRRNSLEKKIILNLRILAIRISIFVLNENKSFWIFDVSFFTVFWWVVVS